MKFLKKLLRHLRKKKDPITANERASLLAAEWLKNDLGSEKVNPPVEWRRFLFHGTKEQQEKFEAALSEDGVTRKTIYMILKYLTINPECQDILQEQFPDV